MTNESGAATASVVNPRTSKRYTTMGIYPRHSEARFAGARNPDEHRIRFWSPAGLDRSGMPRFAVPTVPFLPAAISTGRPIAWFGLDYPAASDRSALDAPCHRSIDLRP